MPSWEVIYKATADFSALTKAAKEAQADLRQLQATAKSEADTEARGAAEAAAAHERDTRAIKEQTSAMERALVVAEAYNRLANQGGRSTMDQHLSDLQKETQQTTLLARARQRGFYSPQQDFSYRSQELAQRNLLNYANWEGYRSKDQYLAGLQRERSGLDALNSQWARRAQLIRSNTDAAVAHANAQAGTHQSAGQLASTVSDVQRGITDTRALASAAIPLTTDASDALSDIRTVRDADRALKTEVERNVPQVRTDSAPARRGIADVRQAVKDLASDIDRLRLTPKMDTAALMARFAEIQSSIRQVSQSARSLDIQPQGLAKLKSDFAEAQAYAARSFDGIEQASRRSADGTSSGWARARIAVHDTFASMRAAAEDASGGIVGRFTAAQAALRSSFSGGAGGGGLGAGLAAGFADFGKTVGSLASDIPGKLGLIGAGILALIQLVPALAAGLGALGSVAATLPVFLGAAGAAFVTLAAAVLPVIEALQKYGALVTARQQVESGGLQSVMAQQQAVHSLADAQFGLTQAVVQGSQTQIAAAHSVKDAEFNLAEARYSAAQQAVSDSHNVAEAQYSLKQAYLASSMSQAQSSMQVASAFHGLQDAQFAVTQSQFQLNMAWVQARRSMQDLEMQVASASLNLRGAQLNLEQAQSNYAQVMAQSTSTALQRAQAAYQIQEAELALKQVQVSNTRNEQDLQSARKYGIKQYFGVAQAQHAVVDAQFAEIAAQKQLILTQREAANAQITAAHQITDAVFALHMAQRAQGHDAITSAHSVSDAQFALAQAQFAQGQAVTQSQHQIGDARFAVHQAMDQLKLDAQAGGAAAVGAFTAFQGAMAELSPAARAAVRALEPIYRFFIENTAIQQAFFGAFDKHLEALGTNDARLLDPLRHMMVAIARALGDVSGRFLDWFTALANSPAWRLFTRVTVRIIEDFGGGLINIAGAMAKIAQAAAPLATWIADGFLHWTKSFLDWANASLKPGSMLHMLLREAKPALRAVGDVLKGIVDAVEILAGGTPKFNKKTGFIESVSPSTSQQGAFRTFVLLLKVLGLEVLPKLAEILNKLASPQLASALVRLLGALATLLLNVVTAPGFMTAFVTFVDAFTVLVSGLAGLARNRVVGTVLGDIAGALVTLSVLKFAGVFALLGVLGKIVTHIKGIKDAEGLFAKVGAFFGLGGKSGKLSADTAGMQGAADTMGTASGAMQRAADTMVTAAGRQGTAATTEAAAADTQATAATGEEAAAAGGTAGAAGAAGGKGGRFAGVAGAVPFVGLGVILGQVLQALGSRASPPGTQAGKTSSFIQGQAFKSGNAAEFFGAGFVAPVMRFFTHDLPSYVTSLVPMWGHAWSNVGKFFSADVGSPIGKFFGSLLPDWLGAASTGWSGLWDKAKSKFSADVWQPFTGFFGSSLPNWLGAAGSGWAGLWDKGRSRFSQDIWQPFTGFFGTSIPNWFGASGKGWTGLWDKAQARFGADIGKPFLNFFTSTVPGWFDSIGRFWAKLWDKGWGSFKGSILQPMGRWLTETLPSGITGAFRSAVNWVINNVINHVIGFINDTVGKIPGVPNIPKVGDIGAPSGGGGGGSRAGGARHGLASGGEVTPEVAAGQAEQAPQLRQGGHLAHRGGGPRQDNRLIWASDGEFVVNAEATRRHRPLIEAINAQRYASGGEVYRNPFRRISGLAANRVDMGVDYSGSGWLYALGPGVIRGTLNSGWPGGAYIDEQLTSGPYAGKHVFQAEDITPRVRVGQRVNSGTPIGYLHGGMEIGWGDGRGGTMAQAYHQEAGGGDPGAHPTAFGALMNSLLKSLGAPGGFMRGQPVGSIPRNWPTVGSISFGRKALKLFESIFGGVGGFVGGIAHKAEALLKSGALKSFNWLWGHTVRPLEKHFGIIDGKGSIPGNLAAWALDRIHKAVTSMLSTASAAQGGGPASADAAQARRYARGQLPRYGWGQEQWPPLATLWDQESGWNRFAQNPSSGAFGIPQALPYSKMPKAAWPVSAGGQASAASQIDWGLGYVRDRYGSPAGAEAHERAHNWYAAGGPVGEDQPDFSAPFRAEPRHAASYPVPPRLVPPRLASGGDILRAVRSAGASPHARDSMLLGSWLESRWNPKSVGQGSYGPWQIQLSAHKGVTRAEAENPPWAARFMRPAYEAGVSKAGWGELPYDAEQAAFFAERPRADYYATQGTGAVEQGWSATQALLGRPQPPPPAPHGHGGGHHVPRSAPGAWGRLEAAQEHLAKEVRHFGKRRFPGVHKRHPATWHILRREQDRLGHWLGAEERAWGELAKEHKASPAAMLPSAWRRVERQVHDGLRHLRHDHAIRHHERPADRHIKAALKRELARLRDAEALWRRTLIPGRGLNPAQRWGKDYNTLLSEERQEKERYTGLEHLGRKYSVRRHPHQSKYHHGIHLALREAAAEQELLVKRFRELSGSPAEFTGAEWHGLMADTTDLLAHLEGKREHHRPPHEPLHHPRHRLHHPRKHPQHPASAVVGAVMATTPELKTQESMLLGSWLESRWDSGKRDHGRYGAFQLRPHKHLTRAQAESPHDSAHHMLPYYQAALNRVGHWDTLPYDAERAAHFAQPGHPDYYASQGSTAVSAGWRKVTEAVAGYKPPPPRHHGPPDHDPPVVGWRHLRRAAPGVVDPLITALARLRSGEDKAFKAWQDLYGHGARFPGTPGPPAPPPLVPPPHGLPDVLSLIHGGPGVPEYAAGGLVGVPELSFGQVPMPRFSPVPPAASTPARHSEPPRTVSDAGTVGQGQRAGNAYEVHAINIHNPVRERAGESLTRATQKLSFLAGRGVV